MKSSLNLAFLIVWLVAQVVIAWAPFRLDLDLPRSVNNDAEFLEDGMLAFSGDQARAVTDPPLPWNRTRDLTVDLTVRSGHRDQYGPARILTIARDHHNANLMIGQEGDALIVRVRRSGSDDRGIPPIVVSQVFERPEWQRIRVQVDDSVRVTVDGGATVTRMLGVDPFTTWDPTYRIALGDEVAAVRPWNGVIRDAHISAGGQRYDLLSQGALDIPATFLYVPARMRDTIRLRDAPAILRSVLHLMAWIPAGALLAVRLPVHRRMLRVGVFAVGFALLLQLGKVVIDGRHPSLLVVVTQTAGALTGVLVAALVLSYWCTRPRSQKAR